MLDIDQNYYNCQSRCSVIKLDWGLWGSGKSSILVNKELTVSAIRAKVQETHSALERLLLNVSCWAWRKLSLLLRGHQRILQCLAPTPRAINPCCTAGPRKGQKTGLSSGPNASCCLHYDSYVLNSLMSRKWAVSQLVTTGLTGKKRRLIKATLWFF